MSFSKEKNSKMRTAFIRVSAVNHVTQDNDKLGVKAGDVIEYTLKDILDVIDNWQKRKKFDYFLVSHNKDEENRHFHIVLSFPSTSLCDFKTLKNKFPFGNIDSCRTGVNNCVKYLVHFNNPEKKQYDWSEVITNAPAKLEKYKLPNSTSIDVATKAVIDKILSGEIKECEYEKIPSEIFIHNRSKNMIKNAFEYRNQILSSNPSRNLQVFVLQGPTRCGKSTFANEWAKKNFKSIYFSSSSNDIVEGLKGEDVLFIDDFNRDNLKIEDFLKIIDPHYNTTIKSRYHNKLFTGDTIFIATNTPIIEWYSDCESESIRSALFARVNAVIDFQDYKLKYNVRDGYSHGEFSDKYYYSDFPAHSARMANSDNFKLNNGVANYTVNKIVNLADIKDDALVRELIDTCYCYKGRTLLSVDGKKHYFDLNKYITISDDNARDDIFLKQLEDM